MLAKLTSKNQLTLPKAAVEAAGSPSYFQIDVRAGQLVLTPVRLQRADAVRAKLAQLNLGDDDLAAAVAWARAAASSNDHRNQVAEAPAAYRTGSRAAKAKKPASTGEVVRTPRVAAKVGKSTKTGKGAGRPAVRKVTKASRKRPG
jgi:hypothetical protein